MFNISAQDKQICLTDSEHPFAAINPPIFQNSIFAFKNIADFIAYRDKTLPAYCYSRGNNPTVNVLEEKLAQLDRGEKCRVFASGMGATTAVLISLLQSGDHVLIINEVYGPVREYLGFMQSYGITHDIIDADEVTNLGAHIKPNTKVIYTEAPGTMTFRFVDLAEIVCHAKANKITTIIDNTCLTPLLQKPLSIGFDITIYSLSKYTGGHSDIIGGAVVSSELLMQRIDKYGFKLQGAVFSPNDAFLVLRGLRTLPTRLEALYPTTCKVVEFLAAHHKVAEVLHPLTYPDRLKQKYYRQASGVTSLLAIRLRTNDTAQIRKFIDGLNTFYITVSWGGYENLVMVQDLIELKQAKSDKVIIRLALGFLDSQTIIDDLQQALSLIG